MNKQKKKAIALPAPSGGGTAPEQFAESGDPCFLATTDGGTVAQRLARPRSGSEEERLGEEALFYLSFLYFLFSRFGG